MPLTINPYIINNYKINDNKTNKLTFQKKRVIGDLPRTPFNKLEQGDLVNIFKIENPSLEILQKFSLLMKDNTFENLFRVSNIEENPSNPADKLLCLISYDNKSMFKHPISDWKKLFVCCKLSEKLKAFFTA